jgi:hypothetical protein
MAIVIILALQESTIQCIYKYLSICGTGITDRTQCSSILEKLIVAQIIRKLYAFYRI